MKVEALPLLKMVASDTRKNFKKFRKGESDVIEKKRAGSIKFEVNEEYTERQLEWLRLAQTEAVEEEDAGKNAGKLLEENEETLSKSNKVTSAKKKV